MTSIGTSLFAGTSNGILRSVDSGAVWDTVSNDKTIAALISNGNMIFAGVVVVFHILTT